MRAAMRSTVVKPSSLLSPAVRMASAPSEITDDQSGARSGVKALHQ